MCALDIMIIMPIIMHAVQSLISSLLFVYSLYVDTRSVVKVQVQVIISSCQNRR